MAYNATKIGVLRALRQDSGYETVPSADTVDSTGFAVEAEVFMPPTTREIFERAAVKHGFYELPPVSGSPYGAEFTIRKPLHGFSASAVSANPTDSPDSIVLESLLGAASKNNYEASAVQASSTSSAIKVTDSDGGNYTSGLALLVSQMGGFINNIDDVDNELDLILELETAPTTSDTIFGSNTVYLSTDATKAFSFTWRSQENNTRMHLQSCVPTTATITLGPKDNYPMIEVTFQCNKMVSDPAGSAIGAFEYTFPVLPVPFKTSTTDKGSRLVFQDVSGTVTATELDIEGLQIVITQELLPQLSHNSVSGVADVQVINRTVEVSMKGVLGVENPYDDTGAVLTDISNSAPKAVQLQIGSTAGQTFMMLLPSPIQTEVPAVEDLGGVFGLSFMMKPGNYGGSNTTIADSDFRLAFL